MAENYNKRVTEAFEKPGKHDNGNGVPVAIVIALVGLFFLIGINIGSILG